MNSGLPFLLDAIFGKKDLSSVSLDEMYEVINEFPSFNAGHFLLSKKLKEQNTGEFEKENMRTALYFHNAFWLQTLLDEGENIWKEEKQVPFKYTQDDDLIVENLKFETIKSDEKFSNEKFSSPADELDEETDEILNQEIEEKSIEDNVEFQKQEMDTVGMVTSFDDLISKYKIDSIEPFGDPPYASDGEHIPPSAATSSEEPIQIFFEESMDEKVHEEPAVSSIDLKTELPVELNTEQVQVPFADSDYSQMETVEEIVNEYGIFEEVVIKRADLDREAFDRPIDLIPVVSEPLPLQVEILPGENGIILPELVPVEDESIIENKINEGLSERTDERDYEAFDGPSQIVVEEENQMEILSETVSLPINELDEQKTIPAFNAKNAESIVFAPYHMIDYFASQGIKLVLEEQPSDNLGKQLKSFTDWLKVMKKLPSRHLPDKTEEKEAERIRHFAAHSIEERDILTESMAEVLAKQGMYENAIALFQKLSLIYPPKSAYFASRIEQLKASLP
ncbi:MAG TPA: hypothetical protein VNW49_15805 [Puia sp.]|nr:hypothetical protein [Puia sp.]